MAVKMVLTLIHQKERLTKTFTDTFLNIWEDVSMGILGRKGFTHSQYRWSTQ